MTHIQAVCVPETLQYHHSACHVQKRECASTVNFYNFLCFLPIHVVINSHCHLKCPKSPNSTVWASSFNFLFCSRNVTNSPSLFAFPFVLNYLPRDCLRLYYYHHCTLPIAWNTTLWVYRKKTVFYQQKPIWKETIDSVKRDYSCDFIGDLNCHRQEWRIECARYPEGKALIF